MNDDCWKELFELSTGEQLPEDLYIITESPEQPKTKFSQCLSYLYHAIYLRYCTDFYDRLVPVRVYSKSPWHIQ